MCEGVDGVTCEVGESEERVSKEERENGDGERRENRSSGRPYTIILSKKSERKRETCYIGTTSSQATHLTTRYRIAANFCW